jgi:predicted DNA-binding transcriptional regulator YafY
MASEDESAPSQVTFDFDASAIRAADLPSEDSTRLIYMMCTLIRTKTVAFDSYYGRFSRSSRTFKRDIAKLRDLGEQYGFSLVSLKTGGVRLEKFENLRGTAAPADTSLAAADTLQAVVDALGDVIGRQLDGHVALAGGSVDRFLRIATPRLIANTEVAEAYGSLRNAWAAGSRVRFSYPARDLRSKPERIVEPYLTTYVAGRYYLVGYDVRPRSGGWRQYALDRITGPIVRAGTFERRVVPAAYRGEDAIGLFKTGSATEVTVRLSRTIAEAVIARKWQRAQRFEREPGGDATIVFEVHDLGEAVRWSLGFGTEARVLAPPEAVHLSRTMALEIAAGYAPGDDASRSA